MKIILNNRTEEFEANQLSVQDIIDAKNFSFKLLVVKLNGKLVKKHDYEKCRVTDGDKLDIIHLISGG